MLKACCGATPMTPHICPGARTVLPKTQNPPGRDHSHSTHAPGGRPRSPQDKGGHSGARTPAGRGLKEACGECPGADSRMLTRATTLHDGAIPGPSPPRCTAGHPLTVGLLLNMGFPTMGPLLLRVESPSDCGAPSVRGSLVYSQRPALELGPHGHNSFSVLAWCLLLLVFPWCLMGCRG